MEETWLYHHDPETKQQSMEWRHSGSPRPDPKKIRVQKSAGKVPASIFWGQDGILLIDYLPKGQTINAEYYLCWCNWRTFWRKDAAEGHQGVLFLHNNALAHRALATQKKLAYLSFQCLEHPPYFPDLAPSDYHLFSGLKKQLKGRHFSFDAEVNAAAETWLDRQLSDFFWVACKS